jgi:hypothetical protein
MDTLKFPLEFKDGDAVRLQQGTRPYYELLLGLGIVTKIGELKITPKFGIIDPAFDAGAKEQLLILVAQNFPELTITKLKEKISDNGGTATFEISFEING